VSVRGTYVAQYSARWSFQIHQVLTVAAPDEVVRTMENSMLAAQLWDLRSTLERQLRCLTTVQQAHGAFRRSKDRSERAEIRSHIVRDLTDIGDLVSAVTTTLADALVQTKEELAVD
jgi:hypothetical protein